MYASINFENFALRDSARVRADTVFVFVIKYARLLLVTCVYTTFRYYYELIIIAADGRRSVSRIGTFGTHLLIVEIRKILINI